MKIIYLCLVLMLKLSSCSSIETKPNLILNEFFNYTTFPFLSLSPTNQYLLIQTKRPLWDTSSYENALWLYDIQKQTKKLITTSLHEPIEPQWSPSGNYIALLSSDSLLMDKQCIYLYSLVSDKLLPIHIGDAIPLTLTWSSNDSSFYLAGFSPWLSEKDDNFDEDEWQDVIQHRQKKTLEHSTIYRFDLNIADPSLPAKKNIITDVPLAIIELLFVPFEEKLICRSVSINYEKLENFELYSIDLRNKSFLSRLTTNEIFEHNLRLSTDGKHVLFIGSSRCSNYIKSNDTQDRLYSLNIVNKQITRLAKHFHGNIMRYATMNNGGVYILGQLGTEVQIYTQQSSTKNLIRHNGWNGTYESITSSSNHGSIAFIYSSFGKPMEVYFVNNIDRLTTARVITDENKLFNQRTLPQAKIFSWVNEDDHQTIEGILHYPPGKFNYKNLPLLVLIHGGPYYASLNRLYPSMKFWAPLAASEGWLVLEPNYRGSLGYGDQFLNEIRYRPLSLPGKDILSGVNYLINNGIADPYRLTVGGYSYGGFLTNWLITQTKRFNAALSGAGAVDHTSTWGTMDLPAHVGYLFGGFPWEVPHIYQNEAPIYQLDRIRTPTHIVTGENDKRVPASQSYILERGLYYQGVPVKLITFPNVGHDLDDNPWHRKIKVREELKWLQKYGNRSSRTL